MATLAALAGGGGGDFEDTRTGFPVGDCEVRLIGRAKDREKSSFKWSDLGIQGLVVARRPLVIAEGADPNAMWESYEVSAPGITKAIPGWTKADNLSAEYALDINARPAYKINMALGTPYYDQRRQRTITPKVFKAL